MQVQLSSRSSPREMISGR